MKTLEQNFKKHPHTARFLQTFHTAITSAGVDHRADDNAAEYALAAEDLLAEIPVEAPAYQPSEAQRALIVKLIGEITLLDGLTGATASKYTHDMDMHNAWTGGREGNTSRWIGRLIAKSNELRAAKPTEKTTVADGRYAVEEDGVLKFFKVKNGRRPGFVFLDIQASDEWHSIRNLARITQIIGLIAADGDAAARYGQKLGKCYACGRTLTDETSRALGIGPDCRTK